MKKALVQQSAIRKKAKQLQEEKSLSWLKARDEAAVFFGFTNYKNYQNNLDVNYKERAAGKLALINELYLEKHTKIFRKIDSIVATIKNLKLPFRELLSELKESQHSKEVMRSLCERSALKEYIELNLLKARLEDEGDEDEMDLSYLITKGIFLKNLRYKLGKDMLHVRGEYGLKFEFAYDGIDEKDDYSDRGSSGSFELTIDKNKNITVENSEFDIC